MLRTALKAAWHVVVHLLVAVMVVTQVLAVPWFATLVLVVHGNAASAAARCKLTHQQREVEQQGKPGLQLLPDTTHRRRVCTALCTVEWNAIGRREVWQ